jgi:hypothetical protein
MCGILKWTDYWNREEREERKNTQQWEKEIGQK